jgi:hypothetical protein
MQSVDKMWISFIIIIIIIIIIEVGGTYSYYNDSKSW